MNIAGLVRFSTVDFPGYLSAVIFVSDCNFDCFYCHNRQLLDPDIEPMDAQQVLRFLAKRQGLLDGVVLSGGEPLLQDDLTGLLQEIRRMGYAVKLDTNGARPGQLTLLLEAGLLDYVALDYKAPWPRYPEICSVSAQATRSVQASLRILLQNTVKWEARTTVIPQLHGPDLEQMARSVPVLPSYYLQLYRRPEHYRQVDRFRVTAPAMTPAEIQSMARQLQSFQPHIRARC